MSTKPYRIKQGDLLPVLTGTLTGLPSDMVPIPPGTLVQFHMMDRNGIVVLDQPGFVVDADLLKVGYQWKDDETAVAGTFFGEFQLTFGAEPLTFPNNGNFRIIIFPEIA